MRNKTLKIILLSTLLLIIISALAACQTAEQLETPTGLALDGNSLTWEAVPNAVKYIVSVQEVEYTANTNQFYILVTEYGEYGVKVKAIGDGKNYVDSDFSSTIIYTKTDGEDPRPLPRLQAPTGLQIGGEQITWNASPNAISYRVKVVAPNTTITYYDTLLRAFTVVGTIDGIYTVSVMAVGNPATHRDSVYSATITYELSGQNIVIRNLRAPAQVAFNNGRLHWTKVTYASGYVIKINDVETITINNGSTTSADLGLTVQQRHNVQVKAVGDGRNYSDSPYSSVVSFPLTVSVPPIDISMINGSLTWGQDSTAIGYIVSINGQEKEETTDNNYPLDFTKDGLNTIRVKAIGDKIYYTDSPYSSEIGYYALNGEPVPIPLKAPENLQINSGMLSWDEVILAQNYEIQIDGEYSVMSLERLISMTHLGDGVFSIAIRAIGDNYYTSNSPLSTQLFLINGNYVGPVFLNTPQNFEFNNKKVEWGAVANSIGYEAIINGESIIISGFTNTSIPQALLVESGTYNIKVRALGSPPSYANSPFTREIIVVKPSMLSVPQNVFITGTRVNWNKVENATRYDVEIMGPGVSDVITAITNSIDLDLESEGTYRIRVRAIGDEDWFNPSLYSQEVFYTRYDSSLGGSENPYIIETASDLDLIRYNPTAYFRQIADIDLEDIEFQPLCSYTSPFTGYYDGNGFAIKNLTIMGEHSYSGFFAYVNGGTIVDLTFEDAVIDIDNFNDEPILIPNPNVEDVENPFISIIIPGFIYSGVLVAFGTNVTIDNIKIINADMKLYSNTVTAGLLGGSVNGTISNIEVSGRIDTEAESANVTGGVFGWFNGTISNIIVGQAEEPVIIEAQADTSVYIGGIAGRLYGISLSGAVINANLDSQGSIFVYAGGVAGTINNITISLVDVKTDINVNAIDTARVGGIGGAIFNILSDEAKSEGTIEVGAENYAYVGGLYGEITNSTITNSTATITISVIAGIPYVGGIIGNGTGRIESAEVNATISAESDNDIYAGGIAGNIIGDISGVNVVSDITLTGENQYVNLGGIVGKLKGNLSESSVTASINSITATDIQYIGGAIGYIIEGSINNILAETIEINASSVFGDVYAGGIISSITSGFISNIEINQVLISAEGSSIIYAGGVAGYSNIVINNIDASVNINAISSNDNIYAGGIAGIANELIYLADVSGTISAVGAGVYIGGIAGVSGDLSEVSFIGSISGSTVAHTPRNIEPDEEDQEDEYEPSDIEIQSKENIYAGGLAGYSLGDIDESIATIITIIISSEYGSAFAGGIVGKHTAGIGTQLMVLSEGDRKIQATGAIMAYSGGIAGYSEANYESVYDGEEILIYSAVADVDVIAIAKYDSHAGGLVGYFKGNVDGVITSGLVRAQSNLEYSYAGGIAGYMEASSILNAHSSSDVISVALAKEAYAGGISAYLINSNISLSIFDGDVSAEADTAYVGGLVAKAQGNIGSSYSNASYSFNAETVYIGGIAAILESGIINKCYSIFKFSKDIDGASTYIGGISGKLQNGSIVNTYSISELNLTNVSNDDYIGGISGFNHGGSVITTYVTGSIYLTKLEGQETPFVGKFLGVNNSVITNCVYDILMLGDMEGVGNGIRLGLAPLVMGAFSSASGINGWDGEDSWGFVEGYYPRIKGVSGQDSLTNATLLQSTITLSPDSEIFDLNLLLNFTFTSGSIFKGAYYSVPNNEYLTISPDGKVDLYQNTLEGVPVIIYIEFEGGLKLNLSIIAQNVTTISGLGTALSPYIISGYSWMKYLSFRPNAHFRLTGNINMTDEIWVPVGTVDNPFTGSLDGNGYTISGLKNAVTGQTLGLFGYIDGATISNLTIQGININSESPYGDIYAAGLVAYAKNSVVEDITLSGSIKANALTGNAIVGSVVGYAYNTNISNIVSTVTLEISSSSYSSRVGGLSGYHNGIILESVYKGSIDITSIIGTLYAGGIIGSGYSAIIDRCYSSAIITINSNDSSVMAGGVAGLLTTLYSGSSTLSEVIDSYSTCSIDIISSNLLGYTGGLIGYNEGSITRSYVSSVLLTGNEAGEFIGFNLGSINNSYFDSILALDSVGVAYGQYYGLAAVNSERLMNGVAFAGWDNWVFDIGKYPRLDALLMQNSVVTVSIDSTLTIDEPDNLINLLDYLNYTVDYNSVFKGFVVTAADTTKLALVGGPYAMIMGSGEVILTLTFDGGYFVNVTITLTNTPEPLFNTGKGTIVEPFLISSAEQFNNIRYYPQLFYKLTDNVDMTGYSWESFSEENNPFTGGIDGDGFTVSNIFGESIFGYLYNADIRNLTINNATISIANESYAGILAINAINSVINNVLVDSLSTISSSAVHIGGLFGLIDSTTIDGVVFNMTIDLSIDAIRFVGGLSAIAINSTVNLSESQASISLINTSNGSYAGGMFARAEDTTITASSIEQQVSISVVNGTFYYGGIVGKAQYLLMTGIEVDLVFEIIEDSSKGAIYIGGLIADAIYTQINSLTGNITIDIEGEDEVYAAGIINNSRQDVSLLNSDLSINIAAEVIEDIYAAGGFIGDRLSVEGSVLDITMNITTQKDAYVGGLAITSKQVIEDYTSIINITVNAIGKANVGGIAVNNDGEIMGVSISGTILVASITDRLTVGGIAAVNNKDIDTANADLDINIAMNISDESVYDLSVSAGIIAGINYDSVINSTSEGSLSVLFNLTGQIEYLLSGDNLISIGGTVGKSYNILDGNNSLANVSLNADTASATFIGQLSTRKAYVGGGAGYVAGSMDSCSSEGNLDVEIYGMDAFVGGLAGYAFGDLTSTTVINCESSGNITVLYTSNSLIIGGLIGMAKNSSIIGCSISGVQTLSISGNDIVFGGLIGRTDEVLIDGLDVLYEISLTNINSNIKLGGIVAESTLTTIRDSIIVITINVDGDGVEKGQYLIGGIISEGSNVSVIMSEIEVIINAEGEDEFTIGGIFGESLSDVNFNNNEVIVEINAINIVEVINCAGIVALGRIYSSNIIAKVTVAVDAEESIFAGGFGVFTDGIIDSIMLEIDMSLSSSNGGVFAGGINVNNESMLTNTEIFGLITINTINGEIAYGAIATYNNNYIYNVVTNVELVASITVELGQEIENFSHNILVGGIVGLNSGMLTNAEANGNITVNYLINGDIDVISEANNVVAIGGIAGMNYDAVKMSYSTSEIVINYYISTTSVLSGYVIERNVYAGGTVGLNNNSIYNSYFAGILTADISGANLFAGGLAGCNNGTTIDTVIMSSYSIAQVYIKYDSVNYPALSKHIGGFVGYIVSSLQANTLIYIDESNTEYVDFYTGIIVSCVYDNEIINIGLPIDYESPINFVGGGTNLAEVMVESSGMSTVEIKDEDSYPEEVILSWGSVQITVIVWRREIWSIVDGYYPEFV